MKKIICTLMCFCVIFAFVSCKKENNASKLQKNLFAETVASDFEASFKEDDTKKIDGIANEIEACDDYDDKYAAIEQIALKIYPYIKNDSKDRYDIAKYSLQKMIALCNSNSTLRGEIQKYYAELAQKFKDITADYLLGVWERSDNTDFSGAKIKVEKCNSITGYRAVIIEKPPVDDTDFKVDEIKWNNIIIKNDTEFYFDDLVHSGEGTTYESAKGTINKDENKIEVKYNDKYSTVSGRNQIWIKCE